jgi:hypothetical protein
MRNFGLHSKIDEFIKSVDWIDGVIASYPAATKVVRKDGEDYLIYLDACKDVRGVQINRDYPYQTISSVRNDNPWSFMDCIGAIIG